MSKATHTINAAKGYVERAGGPDTAEHRQEMVEARWSARHPAWEHLTDEEREEMSQQQRR
ncbi:hypothetical protein [Streptomyces carpaticus]|uniref:hypothetical protein n=1 Tax=Streptomyces carpaticus TaxID=285558 RepID=UPI0031F7F8C6